MRAPGTPQCALAAHAKSQTRAPKLRDDAENLLWAPETARPLNPRNLGVRRTSLPPGEKDFKPEITATSDRNEGDDQGNATDMRSHGQRGGGAPEVFGYPIEVGAAQQAGPPSSGTITCGCSSIIDVGAFHSGDSGSATRARGLLAMTGHILVTPNVADIGQHV